MHRTINFALGFIATLIAVFWLYLLIGIGLTMGGTCISGFTGC